MFQFITSDCMYWSGGSLLRELPVPYRTYRSQRNRQYYRVPVRKDPTPTALPAGTWRSVRKIVLRMVLSGVGVTRYRGAMLTTHPGTSTRVLSIVRYSIAPLVMTTRGTPARDECNKPTTNVDHSIRLIDHPIVTAAGRLPDTLIVIRTESVRNQFRHEKWRSCARYTGIRTRARAVRGHICTHH